MKARILKYLLMLSFLFCGLTAASFGQQDKTEHKNTKIEGKTEHTGAQKINKNKKLDKIFSDTVSIRTGGKNPAGVIVKDKEVGKTDDGKVIYQGPKGGKYYINAKGKKIYIKEKENKTTSKKESKQTK